MKFPSRQQPVDGLPGVSGTARVDRRTSALVRRLRRGDIAVIDHLDLDRSHAEALVDAGVVAVVNASPFISGRYPNLGPDLLAKAGVLMLDDVGAEVFKTVNDGAPVRLDGDRPDARRRGAGRGPGTHRRRRDRADGRRSRRAEHPAAELHPQHHRVPASRAGPAAARPGRPPAAHPHRGPAGGRGGARLRLPRRPAQAPPLHPRAATRARRRRRRRRRAGRRGPPGRRRRGGRAGARPGTTAGEQGQTVSDKALRGAREVVLHADRGGRAIGSDRLDRLGVRSQPLAATGTTEDVAMLLADISGASLIITVGTHATLDEFLDRQRSGLASTFLTRLRVGPKLVDAKGVPQLYAGRVRLWHLVARPAGRAASPWGWRSSATPGGRRVVGRAAGRPDRPDRLDPRTVLVISFRYHIVSIVSVFLALAVGVALGGGPLKGEVDNTLVDQVKADRAVKADLRARSRREGHQQFSDDFADTVAPTLLGARSRAASSRSWCCPPRSRPTSPRSTDMVDHAGGTVGGTLRVGDGLVDVDQQAARRRARQPAARRRLRRRRAGRRQRLRADRRPDRPRHRHRQDPGGATVDGAADSILAGLSTAGTDVRRRRPRPPRRPGPRRGRRRRGSDDEQNGASSIVSTLVTAVDADTGGVVVAGPVASAREDGVGQGGPRRRGRRARRLHRRRARPDRRPGRLGDGAGRPGRRARPATTARSTRPTAPCRATAGPATGSRVTCSKGVVAAPARQLVG